MMMVSIIRELVVEFMDQPVFFILPFHPDAGHFCYKKVHQEKQRQ
jgi:hypothetical protein